MRRRRREERVPKQIPFRDGEALRIETLERGLCSTCRLPLREVLAALEMTIEVAGRSYDLAFCRDCIGRDAPRLLAELEKDLVVG